MFEYLVRHYDKLGAALVQHLELVGIVMGVSLLLAVPLTLAALSSQTVSAVLVNLFSPVYALPRLALFAVPIPLTGPGTTTAVVGPVPYTP